MGSRAKQIQKLLGITLLSPILFNGFFISSFHSTGNPAYLQLNSTITFIGLDSGARITVPLTVTKTTT